MEELKKLEPFLKSLGNAGVFLTAGKKPNTMVASWGSAGVFWNEPVVIVPVRISRFTRELIDSTGEFSISVPNENMKEALKICGSKSGRDCNKYDLANLKTSKCKSISTSVINGAILNIECKVIAEMEMEEDSISNEIFEKCYQDGDFHIMYYGKIVNIY